MAWFENALGGWSQTVLIGVGVALAAPIVLPIVGTVIRPLAKGTIQGGLYIVDSLTGLVTTGGQQVSSLVAEAQAEYYAGRSH